jgi:tRNA (guanine37-N1)-methyltransferase
MSPTMNPGPVEERAVWHASVITLYPAMFPGTLGLSLAGRALDNKVWKLDTHNPRDHATGRHRTVDGSPCGGGPGMVLKPDIMAAAIDAAAPDSRPRLFLTPRGKPLTQARIRQLAGGPGAVLVCGRFEGMDERVIAARGLEEVCVGDIVLSGGELAAMIVLDACVRLLPSVMGHAESGTEESFEQPLLEHPHYTRPLEWEGQQVPPVLLAGNHKAVAEWRNMQSLNATRMRRPDLWSKYVATCILPIDKSSKSG